MKKIIIFGILGLMASLANAASPTEKVTKVTKDLGNTNSYSWSSSTKEGDGSAGRLGTIEGKAEKTNATYVSFVVGGLPVEVCMKDKKGSAKALEGWQSFDEIAQTGGTAAAIIKYLRSYKAPVAEITGLLKNTKELKEEEESFSGDLKDEAVKEYLLIGARRREGQDEPKTTDPKGSVKFWIKDGVLTKYEIKVQGKVSAGDREMNIDRTITTEIKDIGTTKMDLPPEALQKMS